MSIDSGSLVSRSDELATEEPLEIRLHSGNEQRTIAVTMRTPGSDFELAAGFLYAEGLVASQQEIDAISYCVDREVGEDQRLNIVTVRSTGSVPAGVILERHFLTSSACGVCGSAAVQDLADRGVDPVGPGPRVDPDILYTLPDALLQQQQIFGATGGLHAAGLFTAAGAPVCVREDVGRHNAVDKAIGWALLEGRLPLGDHLLVVSGRSSYEIVAKAAVAGIPVVASVSAPSSLAVSLAESFGITLVGFLRERRMNVYAGAERLA